MKTPANGWWQVGLVWAALMGPCPGPARAQCEGSATGIPGAPEFVARLSTHRATTLVPAPVGGGVRRDFDSVVPLPAHPGFPQAMDAGGQGTLSFQFDRRLGVGGGPVSVAAGRFDADSYPDLATANFDSASVTVLLQGVDGDFVGRHEVGLPGQPTYVASGDLNGDGFDDLVATMLYLNAMTVLLANGDGSFRVENIYSAGPGPTAAALADLDGDGDRDVAVSNDGDNTVSVMMNQGSGASGLLVGSDRYVVGMCPQHVVAADFTGDGLVDLATADGRCLTVSVLPNRGGGRFGARIQSLVSAPILALAVADFEGDGDLDLAAAADASVLVLSNDSRGRFSRTIKLDARVGSCWSVATADLDGDGGGPRSSG